MKTFIFCLLAVVLITQCHAHVPIPSPSDQPPGERPPKIEEKPLPPV